MACSPPPFSLLLHHTVTTDAIQYNNVRDTVY